MSTMILNAYKVKDGDLWGTARYIRERGEKEVIERFRGFYRDFIMGLDAEDPVYREALAKDPERKEVLTRLFMAHDVLQDGFKKSVTNPRRETFDPEVSVAFTQHATGVYLRAFCDPVSLLGGSLDFLRTHPNLEDFHYQNQTDKPKSVSLEDWDARATIWNDMTTRSGVFRDQLVLTISSHDCYWHFDPWIELAQEYNENPPALPIREDVLSQQLRKLEAFAEVHAEPGLITGTTKAGVRIVIEPAKKRSQKKQWISRIDGKTKVHANLSRAVNWVGYVYMDPSVRRWLDSYQAEERAKKRALRNAASK